MKPFLLIEKTDGTGECTLTLPRNDFDPLVAYTVTVTRKHSGTFSHTYPASSVGINKVLKCYEKYGPENPFIGFWLATGEVTHSDVVRAIDIYFDKVDAIGKDIQPSSPNVGNYRSGQLNGGM